MQNPLTVLSVLCQSSAITQGSSSLKVEGTSSIHSRIQSQGRYEKMAFHIFTIWFWNRNHHESSYLDLLEGCRKMPLRYLVRWIHLYPGVIESLPKEYNTLLLLQKTCVPVEKLYFIVFKWASRVPRFPDISFTTKLSEVFSNCYFHLLLQ